MNWTYTFLFTVDNLSHAHTDEKVLKYMKIFSPMVRKPIFGGVGGGGGGVGG